LQRHLHPEPDDRGPRHPRADRDRLRADPRPPGLAADRPDRQGPAVRAGRARTHSRPGRRRGPPDVLRTAGIHPDVDESGHGPGLAAVLPAGRPAHPQTHHETRRPGRPRTAHRPALHDAGHDLQGDDQLRCPPT
jgi:hypothetical protein